MNPIQMELLFLHGNERGAKTAKIGNWPGRATYSPVDGAGEILKRPEFTKPGVYILKSDPKDADFLERVYIGESGTVGRRLKGHLSKVSRKPFNEFIAFTSTDSMLNRATVKYLEYRLVELAYESKSSEIANRVAPKIPHVSEADGINMEMFLSRMQLILPVLGFSFLNPTVSPPSRKKLNGLARSDLFKVTGNIATAFMYLSEGRFVVTKGSQASMRESPSIGKIWVKLRRRLVNQGILVRDGNHYRFTEDTHFSSTSAASSVVLGRQASGPNVWIHIEKGMKYGELLEKGRL